MENTPLGCIPQGSILRILFSLIYINDLPDNLTSNPNLLTYDTSLCSTVTDPYATPYQINNDLQNINAWVYQWEMNFSPDTCNQAQDVIFSRKSKVIAHVQFVFNNNPVQETSIQKHFGTFSD